MKWKYKALLQMVLSHIPYGERLNYFFQRHVTKSLPISDIEFIDLVACAKEHIDMFCKYRVQPLKEAVFYEFGAGWDLIIPLVFYALGVEHQILVDIRKLIKLELINYNVEKFQQMAFDLEFPRIPHQFLDNGCDILVSLKKYYGIDYRAPHNAKHSVIEPASIDCITSTNTMEHIPPRDIQAILRECHRILKDSGLISFRIDYQDHYAYFDSRISVYNFLRYPDKIWAFFNPPLHYQNRLRHRDYLYLFLEAGFEIVEEKYTNGSDADLKSINRLQMDKRLSIGYSFTELAVRNSLVVLQKANSDNKIVYKMS